MVEQNYLHWWVWVVLVFIISAVGVLTLEKFGGVRGTESYMLMVFNCCDGKSCTDTIYSPYSNTCVLLMCKMNPLAKNCTYEGKNLSIEAINMSLSEWKNPKE